LFFEYGEYARAAFYGKLKNSWRQLLLPDFTFLLSTPAHPMPISHREVITRRNVALLKQHLISGLACTILATWLFGYYDNHREIHVFIMSATGK
jgi:hypothetical protein